MLAALSIVERVRFSYLLLSRLVRPLFKKNVPIKRRPWLTFSKNQYQKEEI